MPNFLLSLGTNYEFVLIGVHLWMKNHVGNFTFYEKYALLSHGDIKSTKL